MTSFSFMGSGTGAANFELLCIISPVGPLAHLVEHLICNEGVAGSNPARSTKRKVRISADFSI